MIQLDLMFKTDERRLREYLEEKAGRAVSLVITDNSTSMLYLREQDRILKLRLHRIFLYADDRVLEEIADYIAGRRIKTPLTRAFISRNGTDLKKAPRRKVRIRVKGRYHNLGDIFDSVNREYFDSGVSTPITWGVKKNRRAARRTLGSYSESDNIIRINPVLDSGRVPRYFIEFVVYHEMLHADIGLGERDGRGVYHDRNFRRREKLFRNYERAAAWEKRKLRGQVL